MIIVVSISFIVLLFYGFINYFKGETGLAFTFFMIAGLLFIILKGLDKADKENGEDKLIRIYDRIHETYDIPYTAKRMKMLKFNNWIYPEGAEAFVWMYKDTLCILNLHMLESIKKIISGINVDKMDFSKLELTEIMLNDVDYFFEAGEYSTHTKISGGGGGGSSLLGAVAGGVLFGGVGAIIGSRRRIDPITTELLVQDTRETILKYYINGDEYFIHFSANDIKKFNELIPSKKLNVVDKDEQSISISEPKNDVTSRLEKLIELNKKGLINNHEYEEKRKEILDNI